jgi:nucleoid-associated protein YgaU
VSVATRTVAGLATHRLALRASADGAAPVRATVRVLLVTRGARGGVGLRTLPATVTLRATGGGQPRGGVPGAVSLSGPLSATTQVDFFYRGRGATAPAWGEQEQLSFGIRGPRGEVRLGDQFWSLSPLTAPGRAGVGAGGRVNAGPLWAEGFTARPRANPGAPRVTGGAVGIGGERAALSAQLVAAGAGAPAALSLRGRANPARGFGADVEYGAAGDARAGYARLYGNRAGLGFDLRAIRADAAFPGDQHGRTLLQASGGGRLLPGVRVHAGYERERRDDTLGLVLAGTRLETSAAHARLTLGELLTLERRERTRSGVAVAGTFARRAESWVASATWHRGRTSLGAGAELGETDDRIGGGSFPFSRAWLRAGTSAGIGSLWAGVERRTGTSLETGLAEDRLSGAGSAELRVAEGTRLSVLAQAGVGERPQDREALVDGTLEQRLPGGHTLRLRVRTFPWLQAGSRTPLIHLDYAIPLGVPLGRDRRSGTVSGRVVDQETGEPVAGALVRVGERAVLTDGRGRWSVAGLPPGAYTTEIDPVSVGVERVVAGRDALRVEVVGGRETRVETGISHAARIDGQILLAEPEGGAGVAGAVIEASRGSDRVRRVTDAEGRFSFSGLVPGAWTVSVVSAELPRDRALERDSVAVAVAGGESARVELRAVQRARTLTMVSGGDLVLGAPPSAVARAVPVAPRPAPPSPLTVRPRPAPVRGARVPAAPANPARPGSAPEARPELLPSARPWRERGQSGFADWPNDTYVVREGDEGLEAIAWLVYSDGSLWPKLWLANRRVLRAPDRLPPGLVLLIPPPAPLTAAERAAARGWTASGHPRR